jgi:RHS repeat-associated protein
MNSIRRAQHPNEFLYRGEQFDSNLGLHYLRARYYNPMTGRFIARDPGQGHNWDRGPLHKHLYPESDPVTLPIRVAGDDVSPILPVRSMARFGTDVRIVLFVRP